MAHHNDVYKANVWKLEAEFFKLTKIFNNSYKLTMCNGMYGQYMYDVYI